MTYLGVAIDGADSKNMALIKKTGKVKQLEEEIASRKYFTLFLL